MTGMGATKAMVDAVRVGGRDGTGRAEGADEDEIDGWCCGGVK